MSQTDPIRSTSSLSALPEGELLSALADGELGGGNVAAACSAYAASADAAARWHTYHLIGDVLRSDDLAGRPESGNALLAAVRARLAAEPTLVAPSAGANDSAAPQPLPDARRARALERSVERGRWARWVVAPSAVAAGFALVAAGLLTVRLLAPTTSPDSRQAQAAVPAAKADVQRVAAVPTTVANKGTEPPVVFANSSVARDARVDRYLAAHQQFAGTSALTAPSGFLRNVTVDAPR